MHKDRVYRRPAARAALAFCLLTPAAGATESWYAQAARGFDFPATIAEPAAFTEPETPETVMAETCAPPSERLLCHLHREAGGSSLVLLFSLHSASPLPRAGVLPTLATSLEH